MEATPTPSSSAGRSCPPRRRRAEYACCASATRTVCTFIAGVRICCGRVLLHRADKANESCSRACAGVGEWNGDWSDASAKWSEQLSHGLERTGVNDGTFWMDLTHFVMGFQLVDVCMAYREWHARSFTNAFCARACTHRICRDMYRLRIHSKTTLYVSAMQPTKRGTWCRLDRKKSYRLGDVSILVVQLDGEGNVFKVVGGGLRGATESRCSFVSHLEDTNAEYLVIALSLGGPPTAAETSKAQPFTVRFFASETLHVSQEVVEPRDAELALTSLQSALVTLGAQAALPHEVGQRVKRQWQSFGQGRHACVVTCGGVVAVLAVNQNVAAATFEVEANVKVMIARTAQGLLANDEKAAEHLNNSERQAAKASGGSARGGGFRWIAKWKHFRASCQVPGIQRGTGRQQLLMLLVPSGIQAQLGSLSCRIARDCPQSVRSGSSIDKTPAGANASPKKEQTTLRGWFTAGSDSSAEAASGKAPALGRPRDTGGKESSEGNCRSLFDPITVREETLRSLQTRVSSWEPSAGGWEGDDDSELQAALAVSRAAAGEGAGAQGGGGGVSAFGDLAAALAASRDIGGQEEERLMAGALAASAREAKLAEQEEAALQVCCRSNVCVAEL